ncbi:MAU2 chromatid cohesion factor homolog [Etheostoma spectabile]|uniref:MAU2 chromatid cohesion factor homolog n=1 Tax=Etheostoma spectabile TaxID=54343 RepID=UPI0013AFD0EA|nr:MAU2 chromatid cohesion factor homolog [Etheostoma spectabile]
MCRLVTGHKATALQQMTTNQELWMLTVTNLAGVYIWEGNRHQEVRSLLERIDPEHNFPVRATSQPAASLNTSSSFWTDGLPPVQFQPQNGPATSLARLRSKPHPDWEKATQKSNCRENYIKKKKRLTENRQSR